MLHQLLIIMGVWLVLGCLSQYVGIITQSFSHALISATRLDLKTLTCKVIVSCKCANSDEYLMDLRIDYCQWIVSCILATTCHQWTLHMLLICAAVCLAC